VHSGAATTLIVPNYIVKVQIYHKKPMDML
jgi:hypothetical protein